MKKTTRKYTTKARKAEEAAAAALGLGGPSSLVVGAVRGPQPGTRGKKKRVGGAGDMDARTIVASNPFDDEPTPPPLARASPALQQQQHHHMISPHPQHLHMNPHNQHQHHQHLHQNPHQLPPGHQPPPPPPSHPHMHPHQHPHMAPGPPGPPPPHHMHYGPPPPPQYQQQPPPLQQQQQQQQFNPHQHLSTPPLHLQQLEPQQQPVPVSSIVMGPSPPPAPQQQPPNRQAPQGNYMPGGYPAYEVSPPPPPAPHLLQQLEPPLPPQQQQQQQQQQMSYPPPPNHHQQQQQHQLYCAECRQAIYSNELRILCRAGCDSYYHRHCSGLSELACELLLREHAAEWVCSRCIKSHRHIPVVRRVSPQTEFKQSVWL